MPALALHTDSRVDSAKAALKVEWRCIANRNISLPISFTASWGKITDSWLSCPSTDWTLENKPKTETKAAIAGNVASNR